MWLAAAASAIKHVSSATSPFFILAGRYKIIMTIYEYNILLLSIVEPLVVYSSGDIQLYSNGSSELSNNGGILQVYVNKWHDMDLFDEQWINVCSSEFNKGAAAAACRQLGYNDALNFGPYHEYKYVYHVYTVNAVVFNSCF